MHLHEFQAKELLAKYAVPVPRGLPATSPEAARQAAQDHMVFVEESLQRIDHQEARRERSLRRMTPLSEKSDGADP